MDKASDMRFIRTEQRIRTVFMELMEEVGFQKITVRKLIDRAAINRSTFYLHYADKFDLLDKIENDLFSEIKNAAFFIAVDGVVRNSFADERIVSLARQVANCIYDNGKVFTLLISEKGDSAFTNKLSENIKSVWFQANLLPFLTIPQEYAVTAVTGLLSGLISTWLKSGLRETPDEYVQIVSKIIRNIPDNILGNHARQEKTT